MGPQQQGYSWTSTSQWSQLPTVPANSSTDQTTPPTSTPPSQPTQPDNGSYSPPQPQSQPQNNQQNYNRPVSSPPSSTPPETRRDMITRLYRRILGREPDNAGLNYYLYNSQIPEIQIARDMYESTEHQDFLQKAKDVRDIIKKLEANDAKLKEFESQLSNAENLSKNYKLLLDQKTQIINGLRQNAGNPSNEDYSLAPQTNVDPEVIQTEQTNPQSYSAYDQYEEGTILADPFAEDYVKGNGCMGTLRRWFGFR